jgi:molecular chaperone GrpE
MSDPRRPGNGGSRRSGKSRRPVAEQEPLEEAAPPPEQDLPAEESGVSEEAAALKDYDELMEKFQRLAAEFDNYRKRQARDFNRLIEQGRKKLVEELLTVLDNFDRARATAQGEHSDKEIVDGIMQTSDQLRNILRKEGLEEVSTEPGDHFDPNVHEAMFAEDMEEGDFDVVLEVYQKAYRFGQDLLRPARVKVGRAPGRNGG